MQAAAGKSRINFNPDKGKTHDLVFLCQSYSLKKLTQL